MCASTPMEADLFPPDTRPTALATFARGHRELTREVGAIRPWAGTVLA